MFRVTIYGIVAYAFWLTFTDMSGYFKTQAPSEPFSKNRVESVTFLVENSDIKLKPIIEHLTATNINVTQCEAEEDCNQSLLAASE